MWVSIWSETVWQEECLSLSCREGSLKRRQRFKTQARVCPPARSRARRAAHTVVCLRLSVAAASTASVGQTRRCHLWCLEWSVTVVWTRLGRWQGQELNSSGVTSVWR